MGGVPTTDVDVPITAVFLVLFLIGAVSNMTILQLNLRRGHKFLASGALFGFCMARITTTTLRLVWSQHQTSIPIAIAANVFVNAGVIIIVIINLIFSQRVLRASHPNIGWSKTIHFVYLGYYASIILILIMSIAAIVISSYTLNTNTLDIVRKIQLFSATYNALASFIPLLILTFSVLVPKRHNDGHVEKFGTGRFRTKIAVLLTSATLICFGACFRCGIAFVPRPRDNPAWYHSKAAFYLINFTIEIIVIYLYIAVRVDRRFHIPNGASGPGSYSGKDRIVTRVETDEEFDRDFAPMGSSQDDAEEETLAADKDLELGETDAPTEKVRPSAEEKRAGA
jgi:hypothetical protein